MDKGEHQWVIDANLLKPMVTAKNQEKFISPKFKMSHLTWQIEAYPNGNTPATAGSFNLYLRLLSIPALWKSITICRQFRCSETSSGYIAVSKYEKFTSLGWPDYNLSLQDIKSRMHWIKQLKFIIKIKILAITLTKNDGELFYENHLDPYKALKTQTITWKFDETLLHEMKQAYYKKGFISSTYNNMWCLRCYPNGKSMKNDFLIQLQLCGLPKQANKLTVTWTITCPTVNISAGWTTNFDYNQSCWGWGNNQLSFDEFKKCQDFSISVEIKCDDKENIIALSEWQKYADKKSKTLQISDIKQFASRSKYKSISSTKDDEKSDKEIHGKHEIMQMMQTSIPSPPGSPPKKRMNANMNEDETEWIEKRLKIQDDTLEELRSELDEIKNEVDRLIQSDNKQTQFMDGNDNTDELRNEILKIQKQVAILNKMNGKNGMYLNDDKKEITEKEKVENWLKETVKLPQYYQLFIQQGFDELDSIADITKDDLNQMGIDKVGHQRKILKNAAQITNK